MAEIDYALNTFYLLMTGALVMWMAAGFTMLEAGFVRRRNTAEIVTKNIGLYSIACFMYLLCGFMVMYPGANEGGIIPPYDFGFGSKGQEDFGMNTDLGYADAADFFFQVVFVATAVSIVSGAVAERMNQWAFFALAAFIAGVIYPIQGFLELGIRLFKCCRIFGFCWIRYSSPCWCSVCFGRSNIYWSKSWKIC